MSINAAIIVAAGKGLRSGKELPKQFVNLGGKQVLTWSVDAFSTHPKITKIVIVVANEHLEDVRVTYQQLDNVTVVAGGKERADSVRSALDVLKAFSVDHVLIHDAARPGLSHSIIDDLLEALNEHEAAAPSLKIVDALKRNTEETLVSIDRTDLKRVQTPQAFNYKALCMAHKATQGENLVDDLEAAQRVDLNIALIEGSQSLLKLTYPEDFAMAEQLLGCASPRIGTGFDVHAFEPGDGVTLCGVIIAHDKSLKGHSDADVAWHALTDAILGALALGDIGDHFPPSEEKWKGAPSSIFLKEAASLAKGRRYVIGNVDLTIICEAPKIKPVREDMRRSTAETLGIALDKVSVKATTTEKLGFAGRGEGIAAQASVILIPPSISI